MQAIDRETQCADGLRERAELTDTHTREQRVSKASEGRWWCVWSGRGWCVVDGEAVCVWTLEQLGCRLRAGKEVALAPADPKLSTAKPQASLVCYLQPISYYTSYYTSYITSNHINCSVHVEVHRCTSSSRYPATDSSRQALLSPAFVISACCLHGARHNPK